MHQKNIIKPATPKKLQNIMSKIGLKDMTINDSYTGKILSNFKHGIINQTEKNQLLIRIISDQLSIGSKHLDGFNSKNSCPSCKGKGFNIFMELEYTEECKGTHDCLPCNGSGIMTKTCLRCHGITLNEILKIRKIIINYKEKRIEHIPNMNKEDGLKFQEDFGHYSTIDINKIIKYINKNGDDKETIKSGKKEAITKFISKNGEKTFRVIQANGNNDYSYIQKEPCRACHGTGRFEYKNETRTIKCPGCHGNGVVKKHLKTTSKIKMVVTCNRCDGSGKRFEDNPVLNIKKMTPEVCKTLKERGLLKI